MADFSNIENQIDNAITTNGVGAITGAILNAILKGMLSAVDAAKEDTLEFDLTPTEDSAKPVTSGGVYDALAAAAQDVATTLANYYTKTQTNNLLSAKANDADVVHLTGNETIGGVKNFRNGIIVQQGIGCNGNIIMDDKTINGLATPTADTDAANKKYVDDGLATKQDTLTIDATPADGSGNPVASNGVYDALATKQDAIGDLATIRSGAAAGATAVQPATMQAALNAKADKVAKATTMPAGGFAPNTCYELGEITEDTTFALAAATDNTIANIWWWTFETGATLYNVNMPAGVTQWAGGSAPTLAVNKKYEITVKDGFGAFIES